MSGIVFHDPNKGWSNKSRRFSVEPPCVYQIVGNPSAPVPIYVQVGGCATCAVKDDVWVPYMKCGEPVEIIAGETLYITDPGTYSVGDPDVCPPDEDGVAISGKKHKDLDACCLGKCDGPVELAGPIEIAGPVEVVVTNTTDITDVIVEAIDAQTTALTDALQAICDKLEAGITVNAVQSGEWVVSIDNQPLSVELSEENIADLIEALEAANLTVTIGGQEAVLDVNITNDPLNVAVNFDELIAALQQEVKYDFEETRFCILDAEGNQVPLTGVFVEVKSDFFGNVISRDLVFSQVTDAGWETYTLGAEEVLGECPVNPVENPVCVKWKTLAIGLDNTKTRFNWNSVIELTNNDGSTVTFNQTATGGWTQQIELWATEIGNLYPDCLVEPRCNIAGGCGGLLGPVSDAPLPAMFARYVHISCCPTGVYPISAKILSGDGTGTSLVVDFNTSPEKRGKQCITCEGENGPLLFMDGTPVPEADLPACVFDCAESFPPTPQTQFQVVQGCDNGTDPLTNVVGLVDTSTGTIDFFIDDGDGGLDSYTLVGQFVDCETGEEVPIEEPCFQPTGNCACLPTGSAGSNSYVYDNPDNNTDISFSHNPTTIKWQIDAGQDAQADGTGPFISDCIDGGNVAEMVITDQDGNVVLFNADTVISTAPDWAFTGMAGGSFSGKVRSVVINCGDGESSSRACEFYNCLTKETFWQDADGNLLTDEQVNSLEPCDKVCETESIQIVSCAAEEAEGVSIGDQILTVAVRDCEGVILASTQYQIGGGELAEPVATEQCDPQPDVETLTECFVDADGVQWTRFIVFDPDDPTSATEFFMDADAMIGTPSGEAVDWSPCPNDSGLVDIEPVCFEWMQNSYNGYAFAYSDGTILLSTQLEPANFVVGASVFNCNDCIQVFGCRDGRLAWPADSQVTMGNGDVLDISGLRYTEVAQLIVDTYGGTYSAPSLGGPFGPNFSGCQGSSQHEIQLYNVPVQVLSISELTNFGTFGTCKFECDECSLLEEIRDLLTCDQDCVKLDVGNSQLVGADGSGTGILVSFPFTTQPDTVEDFVTPFSISDPSNCLDGVEPSTLFRVRVHWECHDLITGANHTSGSNVFIGPVDASGDAQFVQDSATNTFDNTPNIGTPEAGIGTDTTSNRDKADRWVDFDIPLSDLVAGTTLTTSAFGGSSPTGVTETLVNQRFELLTDLTQFGCEAC